MATKATKKPAPKRKTLTQRICDLEELARQTGEFMAETTEALENNEKAHDLLAKSYNVNGTAIDENEAKINANKKSAEEALKTMSKRLDAQNKLVLANQEEAREAKKRATLAVAVIAGVVIVGAIITFQTGALPWQ